MWCVTILSIDAGRTDTCMVNNDVWSTFEYHAALLQRFQAGVKYNEERALVERGQRDRKGLGGRGRHHDESVSTMQPRTLDAMTCVSHGT